MEHRIVNSNNKMRHGFPHRAAVILIPVLCLIVYLNIHDVPWHSDDISFIVVNDAIRRLSNIGAFFFDPVNTTAPVEKLGQIYRPLRTLSFALDYQIWKLNPFGYHLTNVLIHMLASCLVFLLCTAVGASRRAALLAALIFAAHPANVETVTWISGRSDAMFVPFLLLSFCCFIRSRGSERFPSSSLVASYGLFGVALLSKETAIVLPLMLVAYDITVLRCKQVRIRRALIEHSMFFLIAGAYFAWRAFLLGAVVQQPFWGGGLWPTLLTMSKCFVLYLRNVFVPPPTNCIDYAVLISHSLLEPAAFGSVILLFLFLGSTFIVWRFLPIAGFGFIWFLTGLLPVSNLFPITQLMAERFLYLPLAGISITSASLIARLEAISANRTRMLVQGAIIVVLITFSFCTISKNSAWRDPETLVQQSLQAYPNSFAMRMDLGVIYYKQGRYLEALNQYGLALQASPEDWKVPYVLCNMGDTYRAMGDYGSAISSYQSALHIVPDLADAHMNLGMTYLKQGRFDEAGRSFERAVQIDPRLSVVVRSYLSGARDKQAHPEELPQPRPDKHSP